MSGRPAERVAAKNVPRGDREDLSAFGALERVEQGNGFDAPELPIALSVIVEREWLVPLQLAGQPMDVFRISDQDFAEEWRRAEHLDQDFQSRRVIAQIPEE